MEKKPLSHLLATTNLILHGIEVPSQIRHEDMPQGKAADRVQPAHHRSAAQRRVHYSHPYLTYGKTPLVHADNADRFASLEDIDQPDVRIGVNPGGTNEAFVKENIQQAEVVVIESNLEIPPAVAAKDVDVMITDSPEALFYAHNDEDLVAPLVDSLFTKSQLAYLIQADAERLQGTVNFILESMQLTGELDELRREHMLAK